MKARERLYTKDNATITKIVNIDDNLYERVKYLADNVYSAKISDIINVAIEEYMEKSKPKFYVRTSIEEVTYRNLHIRKSNVMLLKEFSKKTGISMTKLMNSAIKEFVDSFDIKLEE